MAERLNEQTAIKWVGELRPEGVAPALYVYGGVYARLLRRADLYDSPDDVPADCTPRRVRVTTWEERVEPVAWDGCGKPDGFRLMWLSDKYGTLHESGHHREVVDARTARAEILQRARLIEKEGRKSWMPLTAVPVRVPRIPKREVTLEPEEVKVKPCPFCGHLPDISLDVASCYNCSMAMPLNKWNTLDALTNPDCGCREAVMTVLDRWLQRARNARDEDGMEHFATWIEAHADEIEAALRSCCEEKDDG